MGGAVGAALVGVSKRRGCGAQQSPALAMKIRSEDRTSESLTQACGSLRLSELRQHLPGETDVWEQGQAWPSTEGVLMGLEAIGKAATAINPTSDLALPEGGGHG